MDDWFDMSVEKIISELKGVPLFRIGNTDFLERLSASALVRNFDKGYLLFTQDDAADRFYVVLSGAVKMFRETKDGVQVVTGLTSDKSVFGEMALFHNNKYPFSAEIIEKAEILSLPLSILEVEIDTNPAFSKHMMSLMAFREKMQDREIEHLSIQTAPQRIGCFLLKTLSTGGICGGHDKAFENKKISVTLPYDKTLIAARLGMQPETFSRALKKLKADTNITVNGALVTIEDIQVLRSYSCSACSTPPS